VFAAVDGRLEGALVLEDPLRPDAAGVLRELRRAGIRRIVMVSGDHAEVAESIGVAVGVDQVLSERDPADKVDAVQAARAEGVTVMVGDGINDAPALAAADVGVAMGARGATASSESADVVLTVDRLDRLAEAMRIARRSRAIALRALGDRWRAGRRAGRPLADHLGRLRREHDELTPWLDRVREIADHLEPGPGRVGDLEEVGGFLERQLLPHERRDDQLATTGLAALVGGEEPLRAMRSTHLEIAHLVRRYRRLLDGLPPTGPTVEDVLDLRRTLYGLEAILRLHNAQEEELYGWIGPLQPGPTPTRS
jgi:soluble P-type ATPase